MGNAIDVSVVIATRNRQTRLRRCLDAVAAIDYPRARWELILVDNGSTDATASAIQEFARRSPLQVVALHEPRPGASRARNRALQRARGPIVFFTDDDCYVCPDILTMYEQVFSDELVGYATGRILLFDPFDAPVTINLSQTRRELAGGGFVRVGFVQGANLAIRRKVLEAVGGFDGRIGAGTRFACEDVELAARAAAAGWTGVYDPRPTVYHHHGRKPGAAEAEVERFYLHGVGAYYARLLLDGPRRRRMLVEWARMRRWDAHKRGVRRASVDLGRELFGFAAYLAARLRHRPEVATVRPVLASANELITSGP